MKNFKYIKLIFLCVFLINLFFARAIFAAEKLPNFVDLVKENSPMVVNISTTKKINKNTYSAQKGMPPNFKGMPKEFQFFFFGPNGQDGNTDDHDATPEEREDALGSGFIISDDGYVVTNFHVIDGADKVYVKLYDRRKLEAKVIGSDKRTDIALLKIDAKKLPYAKIGDSDAAEVGEWVVAIGEPFGLDYTATKGIISAKGRFLPSDPYVSFLQTDVSINPGNSGGPLFNLEGKVIGINAQIYSRSGGSVGLSFSIPINTAMKVVEQIKEKKKFSRGFLGVNIQTVTPELASSFKMDKPMGALVANVDEDGPAKKADIMPGDIILSFDGKDIIKSSDLPPVVGITKVGKTVEVEVLREGKKKILKVKVGDYDKSASSDSVVSDGGSIYNSRFGVEFANMNASQLEKKNLEYGVIVTKVKNSFASQAGIKSGDVIVAFDFKKVKSAKSLNKNIKAVKKDKRVTVRIIRGAKSMFLSMLIK